MKVILYGATGMVGQGVLRECLLDPDVERVLTIGRSRLTQTDPKLVDVDKPPPKSELAEYDACFFCLGVSSAGMSEADYRKITYDLTLDAARVLHDANPKMAFMYVSGTGTNTKGSSMWSRVKGETEDAVLALFPERGFMYRPGAIVPLHGIVPKTKVYRFAYAVLGPLLPLWRRLQPDKIATTEIVGRSMLAVAKRGYPKNILEPPDIIASGQ